MKSNKLRTRTYEDLFEFADHLNYYFQKNPNAELSINDLKKVVDKNPNFYMEDQKITNGFGQTILTDNDGHSLRLVMSPRFYVFNEDLDEADPSDDDSNITDEDVYESYEENEYSEERESPEEEEESTDENEEPVAEEVEAVPVEEEDDKDDYAIRFKDLNEGDEVYYLNEETGKAHRAKVLLIRADDAKVHNTNTEITIEADGFDYNFTVFPEEIMYEDELDGQEIYDPSDSENEDDDNNED